MTYKQKLESQISFAKERMQEAQDIGRTREVDTWNGYRQGLKYALAELEGFGYPKEPAVLGIAAPAVVPRQCTCDDQDLRPLGQCICGADKVAPV